MENDKPPREFWVTYDSAADLHEQIPESFVGSRLAEKYGSPFKVIEYSAIEKLTAERDLWRGKYLSTDIISPEAIKLCKAECDELRVRLENSATSLSKCAEMAQELVAERDAIRHEMRMQTTAVLERDEWKSWALRLEESLECCAGNYRCGAYQGSGDQDFDPVRIMSEFHQWLKEREKL